MILQHGALPEEQDDGGGLQVPWLCGMMHKLVRDMARIAASCSLWGTREHLLSSWNSQDTRTRQSQPGPQLGSHQHREESKCLSSGPN